MDERRIAYMLSLVILTGIILGVVNISMAETTCNYVGVFNKYSTVIITFPKTYDPDKIHGVALYEQGKGTCDFSAVIHGDTVLFIGFDPEHNYVGAISALGEEAILGFPSKAELSIDGDKFILTVYYGEEETKSYTFKNNGIATYEVYRYGDIDVKIVTRSFISTNTQLILLLSGAIIIFIVVVFMILRRR